MSVRHTATVFRFLVLEEWRLHTRLFGGGRFLTFPAIVGLIVAAGAVAFQHTGYTTAQVVAGLHVLVAGFGLYSGTAGFAGSDMLENVFGRLSLLLGTARSLPLGRRELLAVFLLKDGLFYGIVIVLPIAMGATPLFELGPALPVRLAGLWLSLSVVFAAGMVLTVALIAVRTRGLPAWAIALGVIVVVGAAGVAGLQDEVRSFVVPVQSGPPRVLALAGASVLVGALAIAAYDPAYGRPDRTTSAKFARLERAVPGGADGLVTKTLLDLARSSGGVWKPVVSVGVLAVLVGALVSVVETITGVAPAPGLFFGGVLGLSAFTTYNWLTQFDSLEEYLPYPVSIADVFRAKRVAFGLVGLPAAVGPYLAAVLWFGATPLDAIVGGVVLVGFGSYYYGLTVSLAGFDPNEFLFDATRFAAFTVGVAAVLVPTLVVAFVAVPPSPTVSALVGAAGVGLGLVGRWLSKRAARRWDRPRHSR